MREAQGSSHFVSFLVLKGDDVAVAGLIAESGESRIPARFHLVIAPIGHAKQAPGYAWIVRPLRKACVGNDSAGG